jgi:hypothetical protein
MKISVKCLDGNLLTFNLDSTETFAGLKHQISDKLGLSPSHQRLLLLTPSIQSRFSLPPQHSTVAIARWIHDSLADQQLDVLDSDLIAHSFQSPTEPVFLLIAKNQLNSDVCMSWRPDSDFFTSPNECIPPQSSIAKYVNALTLGSTVRLVHQNNNRILCQFPIPFSLDHPIHDHIDGISEQLQPPLPEFSSTCVSPSHCPTTDNFDLEWEEAMAQSNSVASTSRTHVSTLTSPVPQTVQHPLNLVCHLYINFPSRFPLASPEVCVLTPLACPHIGPHGGLWVPHRLGDQWLPRYTLLSVISFLFSWCEDFDNFFFSRTPTADWKRQYMSRAQLLCSIPCFNGEGICDIRELLIVPPTVREASDNREELTKKAIGCSRNKAAAVDSFLRHVLRDKMLVLLLGMHRRLGAESDVRMLNRDVLERIWNFVKFPPSKFTS